MIIISYNIICKDQSNIYLPDWEVLDSSFHSIVFGYLRVSNPISKKPDFSRLTAIVLRVRFPSSAFFISASKYAECVYLLVFLYLLTGQFSIHILTLDIRTLFDPELEFHIHILRPCGKQVKLSFQTL